MATLLITTYSPNKHSTLTITAQHIRRSLGIVMRIYANGLVKWTNDYDVNVNRTSMTASCHPRGNCIGNRDESSWQLSASCICL
ncbi:unnamed protein product [Protopolystoma xenopodis]|uniref:Uncharacterized protein n=1 Tax=Protopolystoma xenopodis TaxID=117903 RepID=A0A448WC41_9PLAT|nr:unnamed protein product [Protopolystoma xenopodis]